jgi:hypothetical protein
MLSACVLVAFTVESAISGSTEEPRILSWARIPEHATEMRAAANFLVANYGRQSFRPVANVVADSVAQSIKLAARSLVVDILKHIADSIAQNACCRLMSSRYT